MTDKLIKSQEKYNDSLINLMCLTFDKERMKYLIDAYIVSNKITNDIVALKKDMEK